MNPQDFTAIKQKIQTAPILSEQEKQEWLFLLPRMSMEELKELDRILSVRPKTGGNIESGIGNMGKSPLPNPLASTSLGRSGPPQGEGNIGAGNIPNARPPLPRLDSARRATFDLRARGSRRPEYASPKELPDNALTKILRLTAEDIRRPPSIYVCLENVHKTIQTILDTTDIAPRKILEAFQSSPLYRDYLRSGVKLINNEPNPSLSHEEFEAITDFHGSLKQLSTTKY